MPAYVQIREMQGKAIGEMVAITLPIGPTCIDITFLCNITRWTIVSSSFLYFILIEYQKTKNIVHSKPTTKKMIYSYEPLDGLSCMSLSEIAMSPVDYKKHPCRSVPPPLVSLKPHVACII